MSVFSSMALGMVCGLALGVNPGALLLEVEARATFVEAWEPAQARVVYQLPAEANTDPDFRPNHEVGAVVVREGDRAEVLAPVLALQGVERVQVVFADGRESAASVVAPANARRTPMLRLKLDDRSILKDRPVLEWVEASEVEEGLRAWLIERPQVRGPDGGLSRPVLVDSQVGPNVEYPLERLRYVRVAQAQGHPMLDARGRLLCIIFRQVPGVDRTSLCAPSDAALIAPVGRRPAPPRLPTAEP